MFGKDKFYFLIDDITSSFSYYGNDTVWSGKIVDQEDNVVNDYFDICTCELGVDVGSQVYENWCDAMECGDCEDKIFDEEGNIIDQKKYDNAAEGLKEMYIEYYWEMDADYSESKEVDGKTCIKIAIENFIANHRIGEVGSIPKLGESYDCNSIAGLSALENVCSLHLNFGKWSSKFVYLDEFEWNVSYIDFIEGWIRTMNGGEDYIAYYGLRDEESQKMLKELIESDKIEEYYIVLKNMIYDACDEHLSAAEFWKKHQVLVL